MSVDITALAIQVTSTGIREASQQLGGLSTSAANTDKRISALIETMKRLQSVSGATTVQASSTAALTAALNALNSTLTQLNQRTTQSTTSQRQHNESMREAHGLARGLSGSLGALWLTYGAFAGMAVGLAIGASLKGIVTVGKDVEHTLEGIRVRGMETTAAVDEMRKAVFDLGKGVYGPQQVAEAFEVLVLAGLNAKEAMNSVNAAMNLALVGGTSIEKAASTLVSVGTSVGYMAEGFDRVGDVIAKTAALSMSSVATLSEAFKSGSSVAKLYGVSLEDIGTNLGVLSNLGIQGSAAGTAMKNFYKELASGSDKVTNTLKSMGLTIKDLKNADGDFKPLLEVTEKLAQGMQSLEKSQRGVASANLTNERGLRLYTQLMGEWNTKTGESSNALKDFRKNVEDSYGFAAIAAVAMSLTAKSQIDSMINSLKTTFAETFTEMQPEIIAFTGRMKEIFSSQSFKEGIRLLAQSFANIAVAIANNLPLLTNLVLGFTALKLLIAGSAMWNAAVVGITAIGGAFRLAAAGALTFQAALGPIALLLAGVTAAVVLYNNAKADGNKHAEMAADYSNGYLSGLREEEIRLAKVNEQLKKKMTLSEANANITRGEARDKMVELNNKAIAEAQNNLDKGVKWTGYTKPAQAAELARLKAKAAQDLREADLVERGIKERAKANADYVKEQARLNREVPDGPNTLGVKPDVAAANDKYSAAMIAAMADVKSAKREMQNFEEAINTRFRMGEIGKLQMIEESGNKQVELFNKAQKARQAGMSLAVSKGNEADKSRIGSEMGQAEEDLEAKKLQNRINTEAAVYKAVEDYTKLRVNKLEEEGSFGQAAQLRWSTEHSAMFSQAKKDAEAYGDVYPILNQRVDELKSLQKEAIKNGLNREAVRDFEISVEGVRNTLKSVQTSTEGQGLSAMFMAASAASEEYRNKLPALQNEMAKITDSKGLTEAQANLNQLAENQRKMWAGVGESISNSLEKAFGKGGKAVGDLVKIAVDYNNLDKKTAGARIKGFGDAAGAAKNFFKEGSTGYKVMEAAEKGFRILELANLAKSLATSLFVTTTKTSAHAVGEVAATGATAAGESARNTLKIPGVFMSFMSWLGPWGMAAAGVAIAAVLGGASRNSAGAGAASSESRQKTQGSGSVLGDVDAKSESITKSLEIMERNSGLGLAQGNMMVVYLRAMATGISNLASLVVRTAGVTGNYAADQMGGMTSFLQKSLFSKLDPLLGGFISKLVGKIGNALFGGKVSVTDTGFGMDKSSLGNILSGGVKSYQYTDTKKDGGAFHSDKYSRSQKNLSEEANAQFGKIISNMSSTLTEAADVLGIGGDAFTTKLKSFVIDINNMSFKDMSGDEIKKAIEGIFSKLGDDMAKFSISGLDEFTQVGEGYFETVVRVVNSLMQVRDVFAVLGKTFDLTGLAAIKVSEGLIEAAGGLEKLTSGTQYFVENFLTEAERMGPITYSVAKRLKELNQTDLTTIELYKKKIRALDLTNSADQALYASLIELAPAFKEVMDYSDKLAEGTEDLTSAQKKALSAIEAARSNLEKAYDSESSALQGIIDKTKSYITTLKDFQNSLKLGSNSPLTNMEKYSEARSQFNATALAAKGGDAAAQQKFTSIANEFLNASKIINASGEGYTADFNAVQAMTTSLVDAAVGQVDVATASLAALNKQVEGLITIDKSVMSVTQAITELRAALLEGKTAGLSDTAMGVANPIIAPVNKDTNVLVEAIAKLTAEVTQLKAVTMTTTGAIVGAVHEASKDGAEAIVEGVASQGDNRNTKTVINLA